MSTKTTAITSNDKEVWPQAGEADRGRTLPDMRKAGLAVRRGPLFAVAALTVLALQTPIGQAADGDLDAGFGIGGLVTTDFLNSLDEAYAVAIQSDGRIVVAGTTTASGSGYDFALARYNPDGSLDSLFGVGGKTITDFANTDDFAFAAAIQNDGKILVAGYSDTGPTFADFALARYNADGSLDLSFGLGGKVLTDFENSYDAVMGVALQSDGRIVVVGRTFIRTSGDFALARYNADGSLDSAFGLGGKVITDFAGLYDQANAVTIQSDSKIVVAGYAIDGSKDTAPLDFGLARYNTDGSLDVSFGTVGKVMTGFANDDSEAWAVTLQPDGKIVAAGSALGTNTFSDFALSRYHADGSLDASFGGDGKVTTDIAGDYDEVSAVAVQSDGKIVVAGFAGPEFGLARYDVDGALDVSFGAAGKVVTDFAGKFDLGLGMALQGDGKIVAVGRADISGTGTDFGLARYQATPALPDKVRFYLHGNDTPRTAGGFTMNQTPAPSRTLTLNLSSSPTWFSEPQSTGTLQRGATFKLTMPRTVRLNVAMTFRLAVTSLDGGNEQLLGQAKRSLGPGLEARTINFPVTTPVTLTNRRLKLTLSSATSVRLDLETGSSTFLELTSPRGTPSRHR